MRRRVFYPSHEKVNENKLSQFGNEFLVRERTDGIEESILVVSARLPNRETRQARGEYEVSFSPKGSGILV
jgi:SRSO17 transposase